MFQEFVWLKVISVLFKTCCGKYDDSCWIVLLAMLKEVSTPLWSGSENYIFGKFDTFCKRLDKIADVTRTLEDLSCLQHIKVEGTEKIYVRYQTIVTSIKSKTYNVLDHRKLEVRMPSTHQNTKQNSEKKLTQYYAGGECMWKIFLFLYYFWIVFLQQWISEHLFYIEDSQSVWN